MAIHSSRTHFRCQPPLLPSLLLASILGQQHFSGKVLLHKLYTQSVIVPSYLFFQVVVVDFWRGPCGL